MNRLTYFSIIGASIAIAGGGITFLTYGTSESLGSNVDTTEEKVAYEYKQLSNNLDEIADCMEGHYVMQGEEILVTSLPEEIMGEAFQEHIEPLIENDSFNEHLKDVFEIYKLLKSLKYDYAKLDNLEQELEYGDRYLSVKKQIEDLADEIYKDSKQICPDVENLSKELKHSGLFIGFGVGLTAVGFSSCLCFSLTANDYVDWDSAIRKKSRKRNNP